jgi:hypothetical protein
MMGVCFIGLRRRGRGKGGRSCGTWRYEWHEEGYWFGEVGDDSFASALSIY